MIDVRVIDGKLLSFNMLVVEEENNEKLMERICSMLKCDMNNYQRQVHEYVLLFCYNQINLLCLINISLCI